MNGLARVISRVRACCWWLAAALVLVGAIRLAWVSSRLETAPGLLAVMAQDAALGWCGLASASVAELAPREQAAYWIAAAERILAEAPTAEIARGAAWMLDEPTVLCSAGPFQPEDWKVVEFNWYRETQDTGTSSFEAAAREACVKYSQIACGLAPDHPQNWRVRALLLIHKTTGWSTLTPRTDDWANALEQAATSDPDNPLYDYLAAYLFRSVRPNPGDTREAVDFVRSIANSYFEHGLTLGNMRQYDCDVPAIAAYLERAAIPLHERPQMIYTRLLRGGELEVLQATISSQVLPSRQPFSPERMAAIRDQARIARQFSYVNLLPVTQAGLGLARQMLPLGGIRGLSNLNPEMTDEQEAAWREQIVGYYTTLLAWQTAQLNNVAPAPVLTNSYVSVALAVTSVSCLAVGLTLAAIALVSAGTTRAVPAVVACRRWPLAGLRHAACWAIALSISLVWLGLGPAGMVPVELQRWIVRLLLVAIPAVIVPVVFLRCARRSQSRRGLATLLGVILLTGAIVGLTREGYTTMVLKGSTWLAVESDRVALVAAANFTQLGVAAPTALRRAWILWNLPAGPLVAAGLAMLLIAAWHWLWTQRAARDGGSRGLAARLRGTLGEISRAALVPAIAALAVFLAIAPGVLRRAEATYHAQMVSIADLQANRQRVADEVDAILADPAREAEMRAWAESLGLNTR